MGPVPSTLLQVTLIVLVVLPGVTYQFLRERWRGPIPAERDFGQRVLRAITASLVLDAVYVIVAGPQLLHLVRGTSRAGWDGLTQNPRLVGLSALLLLVLVPAAAAGIVSWWQRRRLRATFRSTPTAWDHAFRDRGPCFVRARLKNGSWIGGWYGTRSYATSFPNAGELFLQAAWRMNQDGSFDARVEGTAGLLFRLEDVEVLELLEPPPRTANQEVDDARTSAHP
ncbi:DUF6338 family protein [Saccharopolyspora sp. NPDC000359]|uniref:DUF6338 family protein n=1 Tax=Saccharopolyspora sp. NPDC000359 TaxID=3154251 RepID=UPI0033298A60